MNAEEIKVWLIAHIAEAMHIDRSAVDSREAFTSFGMSSRDAVALSGDLEELLGRRLQPTLAYEYPSIDALAGHLAGASKKRSTASQSEISQGISQEPVAVIGLACRFPGARDQESFWHLLRNGVDAISEVPIDRWPAQAFYHPDPSVPGKAISSWGGFLDRIDQFDPFFFGISPGEAEGMDPQQRLLLELSYEAMEDAGQVKEHLTGSDTGVFVGISVNEYSLLQFHDPLLITGHSGTGSALSIAANRISYFFDFHGPSMAIDTACSSSLAAVHLACRSLAIGECRLALAGGVNLILSPAHSIAFTKAGVLAPDGRCKSFDARANGYVRGEGGGVVVLKPLSLALAEHDPVYAVILGSAMNQDGRTNGLMAPSREAQEAVLREAYRKAGISPNQVQYVETHGSGTYLGDPIEANALGAVVGVNRTNGPCAIGTVKTNIGHLEAAAGIAGLIKVVLSLKHGVLPPSLHYQSPNPLIPFDDLNLRVQSGLTQWPTRSNQTLAGVSSFGFGGTNVHVVIQGAGDHQQVECGSTETDAASSGYHILPLSAHSPEALQSLASSFEEFLGSDSPPKIRDICYTASERRSHHDYRLTAVGSSREELRSGLKSFLSGDYDPLPFHGRALSNRQHKLAFIFPGQGGQWYGMGRQLLEQEPVFRAAIERCDSAMQVHVDWSLLDEFRSDSPRSRLQDIDVVQPVLFAIQAALADLWRDWGIIPDAVVGHSMGEVAAAYVAGILSLEDATRIICRRSRLMKRLRGHGSMMVTELSLDEAKERLKAYDQRISVAASNSLTSTVLSGDPVAMQELMESLQGQNLFCRMVNVDIASHSPQVDTLRAELLEQLDELRPQSALLPIYSTVTGSRRDDLLFDANYWVRNLREPVLFTDVVTQMLEDGFSTFVEISPHPILLSSIEQTLMSRGQKAVLVPSLRREEPDCAVLLRSVGTLYAQGFPITWNKLYPSGECVQLPLYPWQRQRYWLESGRASAGKAEYRLDGTGKKFSPLLGEKISLAYPPGVLVWQTELDDRILRFLHDHRVEDETIVPATAYIEMAMEAAGEAGIAHSHLLTNFVFNERMVLHDGESRRIQVFLSPGDQGELMFEVYGHAERTQKEAWTLYASAAFTRDSAAKLLAPTVPLDVIRQAASDFFAEEFYSALRDRGIDYGPSFRGVTEVFRKDNEALGRIKLPDSVQFDAGMYQIHPALLDACLQIIATMQRASEKNHLYVPKGCKSIRFLSRPNHRLWSHVFLRPQSESTADIIDADIQLLDESDHVVAELLGFQIQHTAKRAFPRPSQSETWLYRVRWQSLGEPERLSRSSPGGRHWMIFTDRDGLGKELARHLEDGGDHCQLVSCENAARNWNENGIRNIIEKVVRDAHSPLHGIIHLWSLAIPQLSEDFLEKDETTQALGCMGVVHLVQALAKRPGSSPRLWLVTRGAQPVQPDESVAIEQSPLWGLGKVISFELPELKCTRIDLDPLLPPTASMDLLFGRLSVDDREDQLAFRGDSRFVPRLLPYSVPATSCSLPMKFQEQSTYLITGGLGGLGLAIARRMVERGARYLVLVGRSDPTPAASSSVEQLRHAGAEVVIAQGDVSDQGQLAQIVYGVKQSMPPLRGVFHCAGVLDDSALVNLDSAQMKSVMAPKIHGTWNLHRATLESPLDFFVLFSSAVSVLGSPGQGNYAAASTFLDAMAFRRQSLGLPSMSINWGPWADVGLAAEAAERLKNSGASTKHLVKVLAIDQGLDLLEQLLMAPVPQITVLPFDLKNLVELYPIAASMPFFGEVGGTGRRGSRNVYTRPQLKEEYVAPRTDIERKLTELWQQTLHIDRVGVRDSFFALGGDSVLAAQIVTSAQRVFGIRLNLQEAFKAFTIEQLAEMLETELVNKVEEMSESEAEQKLAEEVKQKK